MSFYNLLFGENKAAPILLKILGLEANDFGRFRDAYLNKDGTKIIVYTRNGGGNREYYINVFKAMRKHPSYEYDYDDDFDSTYAYFEFNVPDEFKEQLRLVAAEIGQRQSPSEKFQTLLTDLEEGNQNESTKKAMEVGAKIFGQIKEGLDSGENKIIEI